MPQEVARQRLGVRRHLEHFGRRRSGVRAARHVAHGIAAGLARGQPRRGHLAHRRLGVLQQHEVELHVLPRGDVAEAARVLRGDVREDACLQAGHDALRRLDAQHLDPVLTLAVGTAGQTEAPPIVRCEFARLELAQQVDELVDVALVGKIEIGSPESPGVVNCGHTSPRPPGVPAGPRWLPPSLPATPPRLRPPARPPDRREAARRPNLAMDRSTSRRPVWTPRRRSPPGSPATSRSGTTHRPRPGAAPAPSTPRWLPRAAGQPPAYYRAPPSCGRKPSTPPTTCPGV